MTRLLLIAEATIGGTRKHLGQLALGLHGDRFAVTVLCATRRDPSFAGDIEEFRRRGIRVKVLDMRRRIHPWADLVALLRIATWLLSNRFDVVHTHSSKAGFLGRMAARLTGHRRIVHTPHSFAFLHDAEFPAARRRLFLTVERFLGRLTTRLVAVSRAEARVAVDHRIVTAEKVRVIHNGIDVAAELTDVAPPPAAWRLDPNRRAIGTVGLLEVSKGQADLIDALPRIVRAVPEVRCLVVGPGSLRAALEARVAEAGLGDVVAFPGHLQPSLGLIAQLEIFVLPSLWEGFPYVLLEAMALERPVVATDVGGCPEVVSPGETGLLVPPHRPDRLAAAILELLEDRERASRMGRAGARRVRREFDLDTMIGSHATLYQELTA